MLSGSAYLKDAMGASFMWTFEFPSFHVWAYTRRTPLTWFRAQVAPGRGPFWRHGYTEMDAWEGNHAVLSAGALGWSFSLVLGKALR